jgi:multiple sugar transport system ATP-binding protein
MTELTINGLTKRFNDSGSGTVLAVKDIDLTVADGEFLVLVGPSGCGKSTILRTVAGLETPSEGTIQLNGQSINDVPPQRRDIAMVFQSYALYPHMTVRENIGFGLRHSSDTPETDIETAVAETAATLGIDTHLNRQPTELSGGQQQRVALGRAIVRDPDVFLLDEPLSNLDAKLRAEMRVELQELQESLDATTVYVTHDQTEAMTMGDRIAILSEGELRQVGTPTECYRRPADQFVAGFIGEPSMNFFDVDRDGQRLNGDGIEYTLGAELTEQLYPTTNLVFGIRPEDIELVDTPATDNDVEAVVTVVEPAGKEQNIYLETTAGKSEFVALADSDATFEQGMRVTVRFPQTQVCLFERQSGQALCHGLDIEDQVKSALLNSDL